MTFQARHISISINCPTDKVYQFASDPENLPMWAAGLSRSAIVKSGDEWFADSPMGRVKVKFVESNRFGVMDHFVTLPTGQIVYNPFRVVQNSNASEVIFTLYRQAGMSQDDFERDAQMVEADLKKLKVILEEKANAISPE